MKAKRGKRVAIWTGDAELRSDLSRFLTNAGLRVLATDSREQVQSWITDGQAELVIADLSQTWLEPLDFLTWIRSQPSAPPVVIVSEEFHISLYLEAMRRGAFDGIGLPLSEPEVRRVVARALEAVPERSALEVQDEPVAQRL